MNPDPNASLKKKLLIGGVIFVVLTTMVLFWLFGKEKTYEYQVLIDPPDSVLTIDGLPAQPGTVTLTEGEHTLKATRDLFEDAVVVVNTKDLIPDQEIYVLPKAVSEEAKQYLLSLPDPNNISEKIGADVVTQRAAAIAEKFPITVKLPYNSIDYKIGYEVDESLNISFIIDLYPFAKPDNPDGRKKQLIEFKAAALDFLRQNGIDTNTAKILYNPAEAADL